MLIVSHQKNLLPVSVNDRLGINKSSVHDRVERPLEVGGLICSNGLALPNQASLNRDVELEANVIIDKTMSGSDQIRCLMS